MLMTRQAVTGSLLCLILMFFAQLSSAQRTTATIKADKNSILIGQPIRLELKAEIPNDQAIRFFAIDTIPHFEFLQKEKIDTNNTSDGTILTQIIRITSFDSGHWVIPSFIIENISKTDSIGIDVGYSDFNPQQPYHDIKDIMDVEVKAEEDNTWWYYVAGGALALILILYFLLKKKKPVPVVVAPKADPYEVAIKGLDELKFFHGDVKLYYTRLTDIYRTYLSNKHHIHSLQQTSTDLITQLKTGFKMDDMDKVSSALVLADFVKFAKYHPSETDNAEIFEVIKKSIINLDQSIKQTNA